ncbi:MAG: Na+-transporting oxaloacetate decarboxylase subunit gamma [Epsilonproteobacteria bacterium]|nr:MAG: Na+-transporting oxaloacetate decarboxylase subunit gamma [Campylobacterota bacterium]
MEVSLVGESLKFMVLGMTIVFLFLALLVQVMKLQAKLVGKYFPEKEVVTTTSKSAALAADDSAKTAAIIAAITEFKKNKS